MEDVILLVILVSVLYLLLCLLIAFIRALFPGKRSRKSCFKDTFWMFFLEILNPLNWCCFANKLRKFFKQSAKKKRRLKGF